MHSKAFNINEIARETGHDRRSVKKYLDLETAPEPHKRSARPSKLDPYKPYILKKLNDTNRVPAGLRLIDKATDKPCKAFFLPNLQRPPVK